MIALKYRFFYLILSVAKHTLQIHACYIYFKKKQLPAIMLYSSTFSNGATSNPFLNAGPTAKNIA